VDSTAADHAELKSPLFFLYLEKIWMCEKLRMLLKGLHPVTIIEQKKRPVPIDVREFFNFHSDIDGFKTPQEILDFVRKYVKYQAEPAGQDYWKFASETLADRYGDCEDGAILLANLLVNNGFKNVFLAVYGDHVVVLLNWKLLDWTNHFTVVPALSELWYCWNNHQVYTTREHVKEWKK
jgi:hypothetical protein